MDPYHLWGTLNSVFMLLILVHGYGDQIVKLWLRGKRKKAGELEGEQVTQTLSEYYFFTAFWAYFSNYLYGLSYDPIDPYLVWPRLVAWIVVWYVISIIFFERLNWRSGLIFGISTALVIGSTVVLVLDGTAFFHFFQGSAQFGICLAAFLILLGGTHQVITIRREKKTGALSFWREFWVLLKDIAGIAFGVTLGIALGWPVILLNTSSGLVRIAVWYHFVWVRRFERGGA